MDNRDSEFSKATIAIEKLLKTVEILIDERNATKDIWSEQNAGIIITGEKLGRLNAEIRTNLEAIDKAYSELARLAKV